MPRTENGGLLGVVNFSSQIYGAGVWTSKSQYLANLRNLWPRSGSIYLAISNSSNPPYFSVYPFSSLGYGTKLTDPGTVPTGIGNRVTFSPDGKAIAVSHSITPYISIYPYTPGTIGTKYFNPGTLPTGTGNDVAFNFTSNTVAVAHLVSPYVSAYPFTTDVGGGFGSKYSDPATAVTGSGYAVKFHPNGNYIAVGHATSPFITVYNWSNGFGSKVADHASNYATSVASTTALAWHPSGNYIFQSISSAGSLSSVSIDYAYEFLPGTGFGTGSFTTRTASNGLNASGTGGQDTYDVDVAPNGSDVAFGYNSSSVSNYWFRVFPFNTSTGYGTGYSDPATGTQAAVNGVRFHPDGNYLTTVHGTSPYMSTYTYTQGVGAGTRISTTGVTLPTGTGNGVAWIRI